MTVSRLPSSATEIGNDAPVAPLIVTPFAAHRYAYDVAAGVHPPSTALTVAPTAVVPLIDGAFVACSCRVKYLVRDRDGNTRWASTG